MSDQLDAIRYRILLKQGRIAAPWTTLYGSEKLDTTEDVDKHYHNHLYEEMKKATPRQIAYAR